MIRSYTPERRAENSWSYLAVFQQAFTRLSCERGEEGSRYVVVERQALLRGRGCNPN